MNRVRRLTGLGLGLTLALSAAACSKPASESADAGEPATSAAAADEELKIGYFGFAKANSFAQAGWAGVQETAASMNATAEFIDSNFDGPTQVNAIQDAVTSRRFDVIIVQANDGTAVANPIKQAVAAGITVVVQFTPVGGRYDTIEPQVPGTINIVDPPTVNGEGLGELAGGACESLSIKPADCTVAYLQGFANYPLDAARTDAAVAAIKATGVTKVISNLVGGYTPDTGRTAMQNLLQSNPDVNVVIGSSQALTGATPLAEGKKITFVGNGGSTQAYDFVNAGTWYGVYAMPEKSEGAKAAELGLKAARGEDVPEATNSCDLTTFDCLGTKTTLEGLTAEYSD